jgi:hypothetical protein
MKLNTDNNIFINLNELAFRLDIRLGIEKRKIILAGNEKLTWGTDIQYWAIWRAEVEARLKDYLEDKNEGELLRQIQMLTVADALTAENQN